ncbi:MAG: winged helix DNA-binding domain-containing protein, partial [Acidobacteria bacterium]
MRPLDIRHIRLTQQHLSNPTLTSPVHVVKSLVAVQAQDYPGAKWGIGQRMLNATDEMIEQAVNEGAILRLHVMRPTWHFVVADDIRWLVMLTAPRVNAVSSHYYRKAELDEATFRRTNKILVKTLQGGKQFTRDELREAVKRGGIEPGDSIRFGHIMHRAELDGIVCNGARKGNQFTYALLDERVPDSRVLETDEALAELTLRYFTSRGPATLQDFVWWSGLTAALAKRSIEIIGDRLSRENIEGKTYWLAPTSVVKSQPHQRKAHLLP